MRNWQIIKKMYDKLSLCEIFDYNKYVKQNQEA